MPLNIYCSTQLKVLLYKSVGLIFALNRCILLGS